MNCVIDRGNSKTKIYYFNNDEISSSHVFFNEEETEIIYILNRQPFDKGICSSSSYISEALRKVLKPFVMMTYTLKLPIKINYKTPESLGTDRIGIAVGATSLYPNQNCLIISAGTCITFDYVDKNKIYQGGIISPGISLRLQSLHSFTDKLPLLKYKTKGNFPLVGKSTEESMESGIYNGAFAEINEIIHRFKMNYEDLTILITGGDMKMFELNIKNKIFAEPNLQAIGLNTILNYNA